MEDGVDRLTDLPDPLLELILQGLPIKDCARTSVLSTKWRYKWASIRELVFDSSDFYRTSPDGGALQYAIDRVLQSHRGPIHKFAVSHEVAVYDARVVNRWIFHLSGMPLREFTFCNVDWKARKIATCLFTFPDLVHLKLTWCVVKLPKRFKGLEKLESLDLSNVTSTQADIEELISGSPNLTKLRLDRLGGDIEYINIDASNLQCVEIVGCLEDINIESPSRLVSVGIGLYESSRTNKRPRTNVTYRNLARFSSLHTLKFKIFGLKYFFDTYMLEMPYPFIQLKRLAVEMDYGDPADLDLTLCFLRSCPNLEEVEISARDLLDDESSGCFWKHYRFPRPFEQVRFLSFTNIKGTEAQTSLVEFLLLNTPGLKKIEVHVSYSEDVGMELPEKLFKFRRASPRVRFIYDHNVLKFDMLLFNDEVLPDAA